jgi:glycine hydroxymethyltransferase
MGGTKNHLCLIDMIKSKGINGKAAQEILDSVGLTTNANSIPWDTANYFDPSGLRIGAPALTTRGLKEKDIVKIIHWFDCALTNRDDKEKLMRIKEEVTAFALTFPLPSDSL